jgi:hypothetical protein
MQKKFRSRGTVLCIALLSVLLLVSEFIIQPVLCFKSNGDFDLEYTWLDFNCDCTHEDLHDHEHNDREGHDHEEPHPPSNNFIFSQSSSCCISCFDLILSNQFTAGSRISPQSPQVSSTPIQLTESSQLKGMDEGGVFPYRPYPLTKFLSNGDYIPDKIKIRC